MAVPDWNIAARGPKKRQWLALSLSSACEQRASNVTSMKLGQLLAALCHCIFVGIFSININHLKINILLSLLLAISLLSDFFC
jgi:hypothetical protein